MLVSPVLGGDALTAGSLFDEKLYNYCMYEFAKTISKAECFVQFSPLLRNYSVGLFSQFASETFSHRQRLPCPRNAQTESTVLSLLKVYNDKAWEVYATTGACRVPAVCTSAQETL